MSDDRFDWRNELSVTVSGNVKASSRIWRTKLEGVVLDGHEQSTDAFSIVAVVDWRVKLEGAVLDGHRQYIAMPSQSLPLGTAEYREPSLKGWYSMDTEKLGMPSQSSPLGTVGRHAANISM